MRLASRGASSGSVSPADCAGVGAEDPETAGVGHDRDAAAARQRLAGEQRGDVDELLERPRADHARLPEQLASAAAS